MFKMSIPTVTNKFVGDYPQVFKVSNIQFIDCNGHDATKSLLRLAEPEESEWKESNPEATRNECIQAAVRAHLFTFANVKFDVQEITFGKNSTLYSELLAKHEAATYQPFCADDGDEYSRHTEPLKLDVNGVVMNKSYDISYPTDFFCVLSNSILDFAEMFCDKKTFNDILNQVVYEYLRRALPVTITE
jgi:hypothetical protein